jgi:hypothetical protein
LAAVTTTPLPQNLPRRKSAIRTPSKRRSNGFARFFKRALAAGFSQGGALMATLSVTNPPDFIAAAALVALGSIVGARCAMKPKQGDCGPAQGGAKPRERVPAPAQPSSRSQRLSRLSSPTQG